VGGKFFTTMYQKTQTLSVHADHDSHQLGLQIQPGAKGLMTLIDLINPSAEKIPKDAPTEWSVFELGEDGLLTVKDGQDIPTRQWVSYLETDGTYYVGLWDGMRKSNLEGNALTENAGVTPQPRSFANITLVAIHFED
jgi:hypothetical protein